MSMARSPLFLVFILQATMTDALATTTPNKDLNSILETAFPHMLSFASTKTVSQANAEGRRLVLTLHQDEGPCDHAVFVKRVVVSDYVGTKKDWADLRRTLLYLRTEVRFYQECAPLLKEAGLEAAPKVYLARHSLDDWIPDEESGLSPAGAPLAPYVKYQEHQDPTKVEGSGEIIMECVDEEKYLQASPISIDQAKQCLTAIAQLHAAAWQNSKLLERCAQRLSLASFHLQIRNPKELAGLESSWEHFSTQFEGPLEEAGLTERTKTLGNRLRAAAESISKQLSPKYNEGYATLVHGDYKAMNVFLPKDPSLRTLLCDFASTGIGLGVSDVAMHIHHAVLPNDLANGGEEQLVDHYLQELGRMLPEGERYPREVALHHYRMAVVDYGRFVLGRFWKAATPEAFEKRKDSPNTTLINRHAQAAMAFVDRMERYLTKFEESSI